MERKDIRVGVFFIIAWKNAGIWLNMLFFLILDWTMLEYDLIYSLSEWKLWSTIVTHAVDKTLNGYYDILMLLIFFSLSLLSFSFWAQMHTHNT